MTISHCPQCGALGRMLQVDGEWADYYHCDACQTAWLIDTRDPPPARPILIATPKKDRRRPD